MKFKKIMLVTLLLLAILAIGGVSASEYNETLNDNAIEGVSIDNSFDEVSLDGENNILAVENDDVNSDGENDGILAAKVNISEQIYVKISDEVHYSLDDVAVTLRVNDDTNTNHCFLNIFVDGKNRYGQHIYGDMPIGEDISFKFSDLKIYDSGDYEIKATFDSETGKETTIAKENVIVKLLDSGHAEAIFHSDEGMPLIELDLAKDMISDTNRVLVYVNDKLSFNQTTRYTDGDRQRTLVYINDNDVGVHDLGEYNIVVYFVNGADGTQKEIGSYNLNISPKSFDDIRALIGSGKTIDLYGYYYGDDNDIAIDNHVIINGNGAILDGKGQKCGIFNVISAGNAIFKNIIFKNVEGSFGGAIHINEGNDVEIINCTFINCRAEYGGAVQADGHCTIENCIFINCSASQEGGAVRFGEHVGFSYVKDSSFINCFAENAGGAICSCCHIDEHNGVHAENCIFIDCHTAENDDIESVLEKVPYTDCTFEGNSDVSPDDNNGNSFFNSHKIITNPDDEKYDPDAVVATIKDKSVRKINMALERIGGGEIGIFNAIVGEIPDEGYEIHLKDLNLANVGDKNIVTLTCFDEKGNVVEDYIVVCAVKRTDEFIQFFEIGDELTISFFSFYGNLTTGNLNDLDEMGWHPDGNFIQVFNHHKLDEVTVNVEGGNFKKTYTIDDMTDKDNPDDNYDYFMGAYVYSLKLTDEIRNAIPENEIITFNLICGDANVTQKRIRQGNYMYKIITPEDVLLLFNITIADGKLNDLNDVAINIRATQEADRQSIYMDLDGGCFRVYVNDVKVENLGRLVRVDDETELDLFRLCGHEDAWPNLNITLNDLGIESEGTYTIKVTHWPGGGSEFIPQTETEIISKDVTFSKTPQQVDCALTVTVNDINYGENALVVVRANEALSGNVSVQIENGIYSVNLKNGSGNTVVSNLNAGPHVAKAIFKGNEAFLESETNATFNVNKLATAINAADVKTTYGTSKNIVVILKDSKGNVLANKKVSVSLNGISYSGDTDDDGKASIKIPNNLAVKTYPAAITFDGDVNYASSTGSVNVIVNKATPKLTAKAKTFKKSAKTKKYTITLKTNKNAALKNTKVTIKINKKTYSAKTNKKGVATFNLKKLTKKGKYTATVKFAGNSKYKAATKKVKITVK